MSAEMKVLLIQPPVQDFYETRIRTLPLGLLYIAASLQKEKINVELLDCHSMGGKREMSIPDKFRYLKKFYPVGDLSPFRLFSKFNHFGMSWEEISAYIQNSNPAVIGISSLFTPYYKEALRIAEIACHVVPLCKIILGGHHPALDYKNLLKLNYVDYIVFGEGERRFCQIVKSLMMHESLKNDGIAYKLKGKIFSAKTSDVIEHLDELPFPARNLLDNDKYKIGRKNYTMLLTSRGCPQKCTFCSVHLTMGHKYRKRSVENVIAEMKECFHQYGTRIFDIEDDNFTWDRSRLLHFLKEVQTVFGEESIELTAMNGLSIANIDEETLPEMKKAGFKTLNIAPVTMHSEQSVNLQRPYAFKDYQRVIMLARKSEMQVTAYMIIGYPFESINEMLDSVIALAVEPVLIGGSVFYPTPGTAVYKKLSLDGLVSAENYDLYRLSCFSIETENFSRVDLVTIMRIVRMINFVKGLCDAQVCNQNKTLSMFLKEADENLLLYNYSARLFAGESLNVEGSLNSQEIGIILLYLLIKENSFYAFKKNGSEKKDKKKVSYIAQALEVNQNVLDLFFDKITGKTIKGVRTKYSLIWE